MTLISIIGGFVACFLGWNVGAWIGSLSPRQPNNDMDVGHAWGVGTVALFCAIVGLVLGAVFGARLARNLNDRYYNTSE